MCKKDEEKIIAEKIYNTVVIDGMEYYKEMFETKEYSSFKEPDWINAINFYRNLNEEEKGMFYKIIKMFIVDTAASTVAIFDGITTLSGGGAFETEVVIDGVNTVPFLHEYFLEVDEEQEKYK